MQQDKLLKKCSKCENDINCIDKFTDIVKENNGRLTEERKSLLQIICNIKGHFNAEDLQQHLEKAGHKIAITTIYRNISLLIESGIIRKIRDDKSEGSEYEHALNTPHHDHLMCIKCGAKVEFSYPAIDVLQENVAKEHGFILKNHNLELLGICPDCQKNKDTHKGKKMKLTELKVGTIAKILELKGDKNILTKLHSVGIFSGRKIKLVKHAPFKGPILIEDIETGAKIMTARDLAEKIEVIV